MKSRALVNPRADVAIAGWEPFDGAVCVADDPGSFPAVARFHPSVLIQHYVTRLDAAALGRRQLRDFQDLRAETRDARRADIVLAHSDRVAAAIKVPATVVPIAYPAPAAVLTLPENPVAVLLADWGWPPNHWALRVMMDQWPEVVARVPAAELVLAGRGLEPGAVMGHHVRAIGPAPNSTDALALGSVLAFPCPATSGPKVKVIEAMAFGVPVVTTPFGAEGVWGQPGRDLITAEQPAFGAALADLLADPERRASVAAAGRAAILAAHDGAPAAKAKIDAIAAGLQRLATAECGSG
jgi:glycosyltransferase involved in cell wall biosynthesis